MVEEMIKWLGEYVQCDLCNHKWTAVFPKTVEKLECPNCKNMVTFEIITIDDIQSR